MSFDQLYQSRQACMPCSTSRSRPCFQGETPCSQAAIRCQNRPTANSNRLSPQTLTQRSLKGRVAPLTRSFSCLQQRTKLRSVAARASTNTEAEKEEDMQIEGIDRAYCDEFVCTSSPQVLLSISEFPVEYIRRGYHA